MVWRLCVAVCSKVTIINFTVTTTGLEDQLLVDVVKNERPDLEAKKDELVRKRDSLVMCRPCGLHVCDATGQACRPFLRW